MTHWIIILVVFVVLIGFATKTYYWYKQDVERREALASGKVPASQAPAGVASGALSAPLKPVEVSPGEQADWGAISDPDQLRALCAFISSELARYDYEFKQPLPAPVIDHLASQLSDLKERAVRYHCVSAITPIEVQHNAARPKKKRVKAKNASDQQP